MPTFPMTTHYRFQQVGDVDVFYREAGPADAPVILLLHGFPTASHMFRDLIPLLAGCCYRLIAPDLPGFGQTKAPSRGTFDYTFDRLAQVIEGFTEALSLDRYALYIFDYAHRWVCASRCVIPNGSQRSSARTATPTSMVSATNGGPGKPIGATVATPTAKPAARHCPPTRSGPGNTAPEPTPSFFLRMDTNSTSPTWRGPKQRKSNST